MILRSKSESEVRCWYANINKSHSWIYEKMWFIKIPQNLCKQKCNLWLVLVCDKIIISKHYFLTPFIIIVEYEIYNFHIFLQLFRKF